MTEEIVLTNSPDIEKESDVNISKGDNSFMGKLQTLMQGWIASIKKHIALMIIFVLIGVGFGLYGGYYVYNLRMDEITKIGGFVFKNKVYDVKFRPLQPILNQVEK